MSLNVDFLGYCGSDGHSKIWGWCSNSRDEYICFWGKLGAKLAFKIYDGEKGLSSLQKTSVKKLAPRVSGQYEQLQLSDIEEILPDFFPELEKEMVIAKMFDRFR